MGDSAPGAAVGCRGRWKARENGRDAAAALRITRVNRKRVGEPNDVTFSAALAEEASDRGAEQGVAAPAGTVQQPRLPGKERIESVPVIDRHRHVPKLEQIHGGNRSSRVTVIAAAPHL